MFGRWIAAAAGCALSFAALADTSTDALENLLNSRASGNPRRYAQSVDVVADDAREGKVLQQYVMAVISRERNAPPAARLSDAVRERYFAASRDRIRAMAEKRGNSLAWYLLSLEKNDRTMLKRAADGGNVQALNAWGAGELTAALSDATMASNDVERVLRRSYACFERAAAAKDANGLYNLGMCLLNGYGCERDEDKALACFRSAADAGHPEAINNIGGLYRDGIVVERDLVIASRWFEKSAEMGNAYGQLNYALALQRGEGVPRDDVAAAALLKAASAQGNAEAINAYGMCFYGARGVPRDERRAVAYFRRSAAHGFPPAMDNLAECYERGAGGLAKSHSDAMVWRVRARALRGDRNAVVWLRQNGHPLVEEP
jgi:TPR repeat protein